MQLSPSAKLLHESPASLIYFQEKSVYDDTLVIIKILRNEYPDSNDIEGFYNEFEMTQNLDIKGIRKALQIGRINNRHALYLEYFFGSSLKKRLRLPLNLVDFLNIALKISQIVADLHNKNIIHKNIHTENILINAESSDIQLIDFSIAVKHNPKSVFSQVSKLEGNPHYISPEQTGRMNRPLDFRADLYALGVTFYELLTGRLPFEGEDKVALIHAHLAKKPQAPITINKRIPLVLSDMVLKLLEKNADKRYQTAIGLYHDLQKCLYFLEQTGIVEAFVLGENDLSGKFQIPQKIYGRDKEIRLLLDIFQKTSTGNSQLVLVEGTSGVGKSVLVEQIQHSITEKNGYYITGKFDRLQKNVPYHGFAETFKDFIHILLTDSHQISYWKEKIVAAVGQNAKVLTDLMPNLEFIIGKQPEVAELGSVESQNRFNETFLLFMEAVAQTEHPLVVFIDELQWADVASLSLLKRLFSQKNGHYLVIAAYRENRNNEQNNFTSFIDEIKENNEQTSCILLKNLTIEDIKQIICDTLKCSPHYAQDLTELVFEKTQGNAFFVNQFLKSLYDEKLLVFEKKESLNEFGQKINSGEWKWTIEKIRQLNITDNVVELMASKVQKLSPQTNQVLGLAACIGNQFGLDVLSQIYEKDKEQTEQDLEAALQEGLIMIIGKRYKFAHARIHQAVYLLTPEAERKALHRKIGRILQAIFSEESQFEKNLFDIVNHLNIGSEYVQDIDEKIQVASINLRAGEKSRSANDFISALKYFEAGIKQLSLGSWQHHRQLAFKLYRRNAEVAYLLGNYSKSEKLVAIALEHAQNPVEQVQCHYLLVAQYTLRSKFRSAIKQGLESLSLLGWQFPDSKTIWKTFLKENQLIEEYLEKHSVESLANQAPLIDQKRALSVKILASLLPVCHLTGHNELYALLAVRMVSMGIEFGNIAESSTGYAHYGTISGAFLQKYQQGYQFGVLATRIHEKYNNLFLICTDNNTLANFISPWVKHIGNSQDLNRYAYQASLEIKQPQYTAYTLMFRIMRHIYEGKELGSIVQEIPRHLLYAQKHQLNWVSDSFLAFELILKNLSQAHPSIGFENWQPEMTTFLESATQHHSNNAICFFYILKSMVLYLYGDFEGALQCSLLAESRLPSLLGMFFVSEHNFFRSLILLALYPNEKPEVQADYWQKIESNQAQLQKWADACPENFIHKYWLVEAEKARIQDDISMALQAYDQAIQNASEQGFRHIEALANELAGKFWVEKQKNNFAQIYIKTAHHLYQDWGANQKVAALENQYSHFLKKLSERSSQDKQNQNQMDMISVMKAAQALSSEIVLGKLLEKLIKILIENAGAERGLLVLEKSENWFVEAEASTDSVVEVLQAIPLESANGYAERPLLSSEIVNYVIRTQKRLLLNDIAKSNFSGLAYVRKQKPKSVLCMPLFHQAKVEGILYLENNLMTDAFTADHLEVLNLLSTQIMVAIENARLYENLEEKVTARTAELDQRNKEITLQAEQLQEVNTQLDQIVYQLDQKNRAVTASINYAKRIQEAMLPPINQLKEFFDDSFIIFRPKDIVSGDFYWFSQQENKFIVAVVDCTGHGVPGAFMSLIGNDLLNEIVNLKNIVDADLILNELHLRISQSLNQQATDNRDGMDISLCVVNRKTRQIEFSGARNPLVFVQNEQIQEIAGDRMSIGWTRFFSEKKFTKHLIPFRAGDCFYVFSDGYQDQFGGQKGTKFTKKHLKELLSQIHYLPMSSQEQILSKTLNEWIGGEKQTDDITLIGFRL